MDESPATLSAGGIGGCFAMIFVFCMEEILLSSRWKVKFRPPRARGNLSRAISQAERRKRRHQSAKILQISALMGLNELWQGYMPPNYFEPVEDDSRGLGRRHLVA